MQQVIVDLVVNRVLTRCSLWRSEDTTSCWRAAVMERQPDGTFAPSASIGFAQSDTPEGALAMLLKTPPVRLFPEAVIGLPSLGTVPVPVVTHPGPMPVVTDTGAALSPITIPKEDRAAQMSNAINGAIERLAEQLAAGHTESFRQYLAFASRFHRYSVGNQMLILLQCPTATRVAGMSTWNKTGHRVKKGEQAIWIWAPVLKKEPDPDTGELEEHLVGFKPAPVWDASQLANLDERPLPEPFRPLPDDVEDLYRQIKNRITDHGIVVGEKPLPPGVQGVSQGGQIAIRPELDSRRRLLVLLHELAHELAHHGNEKAETTTYQRELEAESVAFTVASILGIEHVHAADYVLHWQGTPEQLKTSLATIQHITKQVLAIIMTDERDVRLAA